MRRAPRLVLRRHLEVSDPAARRPGRVRVRRPAARSVACGPEPVMRRRLWRSGSADPPSVMAAVRWRSASATMAQRSGSAGPARECESEPHAYVPFCFFRVHTGTYRYVPGLSSCILVCTRFVLVHTVQKFTAYTGHLLSPATRIITDTVGPH